MNKAVPCMVRKRVAILISGRGSNMGALIDAAKDDTFPAEIALVLSNRPDAVGVDRARSERVRAVVLDHRPYASDRAAFEQALQSILEEHRIEFVCLAGFMRLLTAQFVLRWQGRMLNIHPSLLPAFKGLDPHGQALAAGVKISGATVHLVTGEVDAGPIVVQSAVAVHEDDSRETLAARVIEVEHRIYPQALKLLAEGRVCVVDGRCTIEGARSPAGVLVVPQI
jgi:phosphoribosylglycinamide formyltransferase 1